MKKPKICMLILLLSALLLSGCSTKTTIPQLSQQETDDIPGVVPPEISENEFAASLFFRFQDEPYLAMEQRTITLLPNQPLEYALINELLSGPGTQFSELSSLFPGGTRLISTETRNRTLFVTFSNDILKNYADEKDNWQEDAELSIEIPLRRVLCMQSITATITENCSLDSVQILVQNSSGNGSYRLSESFYRTASNASSVALPVVRNNQLILSPDVTCDRILFLWKSQDWTRLYKYITQNSFATSDTAKNFRDFVTKMENLPRITDCSYEGGSISKNGKAATFSVSAAYLSKRGREEKCENCTLQLENENGIWKTSVSSLTGWLEEYAQ